MEVCDRIGRDKRQATVTAWEVAAGQHARSSRTLSFNSFLPYLLLAVQQVRGVEFSRDPEGVALPN